MNLFDAIAKIVEAHPSVIEAGFDVEVEKEISVFGSIVVYLQFGSFCGRFGIPADVLRQDVSRSTPKQDEAEEAALSSVLDPLRRDLPSWANAEVEPTRLFRIKAYVEMAVAKLVYELDQKIVENAKTENRLNRERRIAKNSLRNQIVDDFREP